MSLVPDSRRILRGAKSRFSASRQQMTVRDDVFSKGRTLGHRAPTPDMALSPIF